MKNLRNANAPADPSQVVQKYLTSSWDIVTSVYNELAALTALADALPTLTGYLSKTDIDTLAELNAIVTDATFGDFATQAQAEAGTDNTVTMTPLRTAQAIAVLATSLKNKLDGTTAPTATDDSSAGYAAGSYWIDVTNDESYRCVDSTASAAIWVKTTLQTTDLATVAVSGDSDDLVQGSTQLLMTAAERTKLTGIETAATADQTDLQIETAYNNQVAAVSAGERTAGTEAAIRRFSPLDIATMVGIHGGSTPEGTAVLSTGVSSGWVLQADGDNSSSWRNIDAAVYEIITGTTHTIAAADAGKILITTNASAIAITLPDTLDVNFQCTIIQAGAGVPTVTPNTDTINGAGTGVAPTAQWKGMFLSQYSATNWVALI